MKKKADLKGLMAKATGPPSELDRAVAEALAVPVREYSASVDACLWLIHDLLPNTRWHVGRADDGVSIYATLTKGQHHAECTNVTVPLALLTVIVKLCTLTPPGRRHGPTPTPTES